MDINWQPGQTLEMIEKAVIEKAFKWFQENKTKTAIALGIAVRTLDAKLEIYGKVVKDDKTLLGVPESGTSHASGQNNGYGAQAGLRVQPAAVVSAPQLAVPVPERQEIQNVSPKSIASSGSRKSR